MTKQKTVPEVPAQWIFILTRKASWKGGNCNNCQDVIQSLKISDEIYLWSNFTNFRGKEETTTLPDTMEPKTDAAANFIQSTRRYSALV